MFAGVHRPLHIAILLLIQVHVQWLQGMLAILLLAVAALSGEQQQGDHVVKASVKARVWCTPDLHMGTCAA